MFKKILIANRGEIACRVMATAERLGIATVAVFSDADRDARHVALADEAQHIGPAPASESYLNQDALIAAVKETGAEAVHPGYGFLSENPTFAEAVAQAGAVFIGPPPGAIRAMGLKDAAKRIMMDAGVPVVPGYLGDDQDPKTLAAEAGKIGYPVLIKAVAGGGGKGMRRVDDAKGFADALAGAKREAASSFGDDRVLIEKYLTTPRHIEVQIFADGQGNAVHLFERDCSLQRRHQKVIEEAPAPGMTDGLRAAMGDAAVTAAKAIGYQGAGTVEFIADAAGGLDAESFFFMEMNTRLQVEHPVTEMITDQDLVEWQLRVAAGEALPLTQDDLAITGHAAEARLYAEDPAREFLPASGRLHHLAWPIEAPGLRIDTGVRRGDVITPFYDPMIAKVIVHGKDRAEALERLTTALNQTEAAGIATNRRFLARLAGHDGFRRGDVDTGLIGRDLEGLAAPDALTPDLLAVAALHGAGLLDDADDDDPWGRLSGWRLWPGHAQTVHLETAAGETVDVPVAALGRGAFRLGLGLGDGDGGVTARLLTRDGHRVTVDVDGRPVIAAVAAGRGWATVFVGGAEATFTLPDRLEPDTAGADAEAQVKAPLPGRITAVLIKDGDTVEQGQALVVLEAMKMEHSLTAGRAGTVTGLTAETDAQVQEGQVLLTLEESDT
ncbi:MAG: acetyl/propionyl/methylcrotonyl-CoA carboxylase subunit alpha [Rhodospirillales bacterium]